MQNKGTYSELEDISSVKSRARSAFLVLGSANALWQLLSWVATLLTARILMPRDYGMIALVETVVPYLTVVTELHVTSWLVQRKAITDGLLKSTQLFVLILGFFISSLLFFSANLVADFYSNPELVLVLRIVSCVFVFRSLSVIPEALLRRDLRFAPIASIQIAVGIGRIVGQLLLAYFGFGYWALVVGMVGKEFFTMLAYAFYRGIPKGLTWNKDIAKELIGFGLPATLSAVFWVIYSTADNMVVGRVFGPEFMGFYAMAFYLSDLPLSKINSLVAPVFMPLLSRLKENPAEQEKSFFLILRVLSGVIFPVLAGFAVVSTEAIPLVLGDKWLPLITPLCVLCISGILRTTIDHAPTLLMSWGKPAVLFRVRLFSVIILPLSFILGTSFFGIWGIYGTWIFVFPIIIALNVSALHRHCGISPRSYFRNFLPASVATLSMVAVTFGFGILAAHHLSALTLLLSKIIVGGVAYAVFLRIIFPAAAKELLSLPRRLRGGENNL